MSLPIRTRLTLVSALMIAIVLAAAGAFLYLRLRSDLVHAVDVGLRSRADTLLGADGVLLAPASPTLIESDEAFAQVIDPGGSVLASSGGIGDAPLVTGPLTVGSAPTFVDADVRTSEGETIPARILVVSGGDGRIVFVGASLDDRNEALARLAAAMAIGGPVALAAAVGVIWLVVGAALGPVESMRAEASAISASEPGRRLPVPDTGDELARLGDTLNAMLERLEEAIERERRFVDDASHELRTPLSNLKAEIDLALRRSRTVDELERALASAAEETDRLSRLAEDLLVLARADRGRLPVRRERVGVGEVTLSCAPSSTPFASVRRSATSSTTRSGRRRPGGPSPCGPPARTEPSASRSATRGRGSPRVSCRSRSSRSPGPTSGGRGPTGAPASAWPSSGPWPRRTGAGRRRRTPREAVPPSCSGSRTEFHQGASHNAVPHRTDAHGRRPKGRVGAS